MNRLLTAVAVLAVAAVSGAASFAVTSHGSTRLGPRETIIAWETQLQKRNFYDACSYEVYDTKYNVTQAQLDKAGIKGYTAQRYCATQWSGFTADNLTTSQNPVTVAHVPPNMELIAQASYYYQLGAITKKQYDAVVKQARPHDVKLKAPKNGYYYKVTADDGSSAYVAVQRDKNGVWKIVDVVAPS